MAKCHPSTSQSSSPSHEDDDILQGLLRILLESQGDEVLLNGTTSAYLVRGKQSNPLKNPFYTPESMIHWIQTLAFRNLQRIDPLFPCNGGVLNGAWRWHGILPPAAPDGPLFCLRRQRLTDLGLESFGLTKGQSSELEAALRSNRPLLICGPTGSGKTSLLTALLKEWCMNERVCLLERIQEIPRYSPRWISLVERPANQEGRGAISLDALFEEALRLLPQRIVVGEIRGPEAGAFFNSSLAGHLGVVSTIHGQTPQAVLERLSALLCTPLHTDRKGAHEALRQINPLLIFIRGQVSSSIEERRVECTDLFNQT